MAALAVGWQSTFAGHLFRLPSHSIAGFIL
jgi:hypothetical protein